MAIRFKRKTPDNWVIEEINNKLLSKKFGKIDGRIMYPSSHDITPEILQSSLSFLGNLLQSDNDVLIVTKPHLDLIEKICDGFYDYKNNILLR
jgi:hypothetical protein